MKRIVCPLNKKEISKDQCKTCDYRDDCIEDRLNDMLDFFIDKAAETGIDIAEILVRMETKKHEKTADK